MKLLLLGSTGLVGSHVLAQALDNENITKIIAPVRSASELSHPKLNTVVLDFDDLHQDKEFWTVDAVICALGSTMKKAGSRDEFRKVDYSYPLDIAKIAKLHGAKVFALNSAMGANANSIIFYNRVKGALEQALTQLNFDSLTFVRAGLIEGDRQEVRKAEELSLKVVRGLQAILPKSLQANPAENIAAALLKAVIEQPKGVNVVASKELV